MHGFFHIFKRLWANRHLCLLSDIVTHNSCHQGCHQHPFDEEQTIFLVQPCLAVLCFVLS